MVACKLNAGDFVMSVLLSDQSKELLVVSEKGWSIRFNESDVNEMGRNASGVRAIKLADDDRLIGALLVSGEEGEIAIITNAGFGKSSLLYDYQVQKRDGRGGQTIEFKDAKRGRSNGDRIVAAFYVREERPFHIITSNKQYHTLSSDKLKIEDRRSPGRSLIALEKGEQVTDIVFV
jgi:topoisomerase-4 subunit A